MWLECIADAAQTNLLSVIHPQRRDLIAIVSVDERTRERRHASWLCCEYTCSQYVTKQ